MRTQLNEVINAARQAIQAKTAPYPTPTLQEVAPYPTPTQVLDVALSSFKPTLEPQPETYTVDPLARFTAADEVAGKATECLTKGARKLWAVIHGVAVRYAAYKKYSAAVTHVTFALPQSAVAAVLGYDARHLRRLQHELEAAGLIDSGAWAASVEGKNLWATTLWAVKTGKGNTTPKLQPDDYRANWRDLAADFKAKNTVQRAMSGLITTKEDEQVSKLFSAAVTGLYDSAPVTLPLVRTFKLGAVQDAVNSLSLLADATPHERRELVQQLAGWLSESLHDRHSFKFWCSLLWPVAGKWEAVGALQAQLNRLLADLSEYDGILNPAAWFNSRCNSLTT